MRFPPALIVLALVLLPTGACQGPPPSGPESQLPELAELSSFLSSGRDTFALGSDRDERFAQILSVDVSPSGLVAVLDRVPPFVHILTDLSSEPIARFGSLGEGPGEMRFPFNLAFSSDSLVAVLHSRGLSVFTAEGDFRRSRRLDALGIVPMGLVGGCQGHWLAYGPNLTAADLKPAVTEWVHELKLTERGDARLALYSDTVRPSRFLQKPHALAKVGRRFYFWHEYASPTEVLSWSCKDSTAASVPWSHTLAMSGTLAGQGGRDGSLTLLVPDTTPTGIVGSEGKILAAFRITHSRTPNVRTTVLQLVEEDSVWKGFVPGDYWLHATNASGEVLATVEDPYPRLINLPFKKVEEALKERGYRSALPADPSDG